MRKPGYKTSEFWITLFTIAGIIGAAVSSVLPTKYAAVCISISGASYAIARGLTKHFPPSGSGETEGETG